MAARIEACIFCDEVHRGECGSATPKVKPVRTPKAKPVVKTAKDAMKDRAAARKAALPVADVPAPVVPKRDPSADEHNNALRVLLASGILAPAEQDRHRALTRTNVTGDLAQRARDWRKNRG